MSSASDLDSPRTIELVPGSVRRLEQALEAGDLAAAADVLECDFLTVWFGVGPARTADILAALLRGPDGATPFIRDLVPLVFGYRLPKRERPSTSRPFGAKLGAPVPPASKIGRMIRLRMRGRTSEALEIAGELERDAALMPVSAPSGGWQLFIAVQNGVTAMLAGDFSQALAYFARARMLPADPTLGVLVRDACAKSAMIEVLYGDVRRAEALLRELEETPRTSSWAEAGVDVVRSVVAARLYDRNSSVALETLDSVRFSALGEMWPFYFVAVLRTAIEVGDLYEARRRLKAFEALALPRIEGEGFTGSVFSLARALHSIAAGDFAAARESIARADPRSADCGVVLAFLELAAQRHQDALRCTSKLRERTLQLRLLEVLRLSVSAGAYLALGDEQACRTVIVMALAMPGGLRPQEVALFAPEVRDLAEEHFTGWPRDRASSDIGLDLFAVAREPFTRREVEVIRALGEGMSRSQIAESLYLSENTVKSHLRVIYRKLGASSRHTAILEAERRGLLFA